MILQAALHNRKNAFLKNKNVSLHRNCEITKLRNCEVQWSKEKLTFLKLCMVVDKIDFKLKELLAVRENMRERKRYSLLRTIRLIFDKLHKSNEVAFNKYTGFSSPVHLFFSRTLQKSL